MHKWKRLTLIITLIVALAFVGAVAAALAFEPAAPAAPTANSITWQVIADGGQTMSSSSYTLMSTTGQPVAGQTSGDAFAVLSGYWQGFQEVIRSLFMPFIVGNP